MTRRDRESGKTKSGSQDTGVFFKLSFSGYKLSEGVIGNKPVGLSQVQGSNEAGRPLASYFDLTQFLQCPKEPQMCPILSQTIFLTQRKTVQNLASLWYVRS